MEQITSRVTLHSGDCLDILPTLAECSIDSCVTDPPYGLSFMGRNWDHGVPGVAFWRQIYRVLKPGAHLVAFGGSRTYHRMACAIEDAGFEIRDSLMWVYGVGFPKSHDVSKGIDRVGGLPWVDFADLLDGLIKSSGYTYASLDRALGVKSSSCYWVRKDARGGLPPRNHYERIKELLNPPVEFTDLYDRAEREVVAIERRKNSPSGIVSIGRESVEVERKITAPATEAAIKWQGWGTALKPAFEPIVLARKPLSESTVAANVLRWRTGALNIDGCRIGTETRTYTSTGNPGANTQRFHGGDGRDPEIARAYAEKSKLRPPTTVEGRWPANVCHDGSDEVVEAFPTTAPAKAAARGGSNPNPMDWGNSRSDGTKVSGHFDNGGSAARFFYSAKASKADRAGSKHPTVKPVSLMQWLCRLITPPGGTILDPFAGSGTTGAAARLEGFRAVLIEREAEYQQDIRNRFATSSDDLLEAAE